MFDVGGIFQYAIDNELNAGDLNLDNGRDLYPRFRNGVGGVKAGFHLGSTVDVRGSFYRSYMHAEATNRFGDSRTTTRPTSPRASASTATRRCRRASTRTTPGRWTSR